MVNDPVLLGCAIKFHVSRLGLFVPPKQCSICCV